MSDDAVLTARLRKYESVLDEFSKMEFVSKEYVDLAVASLELNEFFTSTASDIGGIYKTMTEAEASAGTVVSPGVTSATTTAAFNFATVSGSPHLTRLVAGIYDVHAHLLKTGTRNVTAYCEMYNRVLAGTETLLGTSSIVGPLTTVSTFYDVYMTLSAEVALLVTDRLVLKWYMITDGAPAGSSTTMTMTVGGTSDSHLSISIQSQELNNLFVQKIGDAMTGALGIGATPTTARLEVTQSSDARTAGVKIIGSARSMFLWNDSSGNAIIDSGLTGAANIILNSGAGGKVGIGVTPSAIFHSYEASLRDPSLTFNAAAGAIIHNYNTELAFGLSSVSPYPYWIQARNTSNAAWNISLQPLGGNVGIGTTAPLTKLQVGLSTLVAVATPDCISLGGSHANSNTPTNQQLKINLVPVSATEAYGFAVSQDAGIWYHAGPNGASGYHAFATAGAEKMRITAGGNVGIGTTNPTNGVLEVVGQVYFSANCSALSFTDRTPFYSGDAVAELRKIKGKNGEIDHGTLPTFVRAKHKVQKQMVPGRPEFGTYTGVEEVANERDLGAMISMMTVAIQQLDQRLTTIGA